MANAGIDIASLTVPELARQALVLYVDGGIAAGAIMDDMEETHQKENQREKDDAVGVPDNLTTPEGMHLADGYMGVIP